MALSLREVNIELPWLKVVLAVVFAVTAGVGMQLAMREKLGQETKVVEAEVAGDSGEAKEMEEAKVAEGETKEAEEGEKVPEVEREAGRDIQGKKLVALSFDDGPAAETTTRLLGILREKGVVVTFFVLGNMVEKNPEILKQQVREGHEVGSHTVTHANLAASTVEGIRWEEARMDEIFQEVIQRKPDLTRPPYGAIDEAVRQNVKRPLVLWSVDPEDWKYKSADEVVRRVEGAVFDGAIVLLHDIYPTTIEAVPRIIDDLRQQGYEFLTIPQLAKARGVVMEGGWAYGSFRP